MAVRTGGRWPAKSGCRCGKPARLPKASCQTGASSPSASGTTASQPSCVPRPAPTTSAGAARGADEPGERRERFRVDGRNVHDAPRRRHGAVAGRLVPVAHRRDHERRPAAQARLVRRTRDRAGQILRRRREGRPDGVVAGEALEALAGEERRECEVAAILLADDDHERRAILARGHDRVDGVAEPGGDVEVHEGRRAAPERIAGRHPDDGALVQAEHELEVVREVGEERDLGRAGIPEDPRQPVRTHDVERRFAHRRRRFPTHVDARSYRGV